MQIIEPKLIYNLESTVELSNYVNFCTKSPNYIAQCDKNSLFYFYNLKFEKPLKFNKKLDFPATSLCFNEPTVVAVGKSNGSIEILDVEIIKNLNINAHEKEIISCNLKPYSKTLVTASHNSIKIFDLRKKQAARSINLDKNIIPYHVQLSPDATLLAASLNDNTTIIYDLNSDKILYKLPNTGTCAKINFHEEALLVSACSLDKVSFWDLTTNECTQTCEIVNDRSSSTYLYKSSLFIGTVSGKILEAPWNSHEIKECGSIESSYIYDLGILNNKFRLISKFNNLISIIETNFDNLSHSQNTESQNIENTNFETMNTEFTNIDFSLSYSNFKSIQNFADLQSTSIDPPFNLTESIKNFETNHKSILEIINKRVKNYELIFRMLRIRNYLGALKIAEDSQDVILVEFIGFLMKNINEIPDFPLRNVMKCLKTWLKNDHNTEFVCDQLCIVLKNVKFDSKLKSDLVEIHNLIKNKNDKYLKLIDFIIRKYI